MAFVCLPERSRRSRCPFFNGIARCGDARGFALVGAGQRHREGALAGHRVSDVHCTHGRSQAALGISTAQQPPFPFPILDKVGQKEFGGGGEEWGGSEE